MASYSWLTLSQAVNALQGRLQNSAFWTYDECVAYLTESLRLWNALTEQWNTDFTFTAQGAQWANMGTLAGSPRLRTVTDADIYTQMQMMLLEPPTGATWTGTIQFDLASMQSALQKRRDEVIQATGCNLVNLSLLPTTPGTHRTMLPDTVLEPIRNRFLGVVASTTGTASSGSTSLSVASNAGILVGQTVSGANFAAGTFVVNIAGNTITLSLPTTGIVSGTVEFSQSVTLTREDTQAFQYFEPNYLQTVILPQSWSVPSEPPLAFDVDDAPTMPGNYDMIALQSGPVFNPPTPSLLGVPNDWSWLPMYGALADLLGCESQRTDRERAAYCLKRYTDGIQIMRKSNWLVQANINGVVVDTPALFEHDSYKVGWQTNANLWPALVQAGMDLVAACPGSSQSVNVTLVGNAPIPATPTDFVQVSRDVFDVVLSYAQRLALFKMGGDEWAGGQSLEDDFFRVAAETNKRLMQLGIFNDVLRGQGQRQNVVVPR